jgi:hypothetical protein
MELYSGEIKNALFRLLVKSFAASNVISIVGVAGAQLATSVGHRRETPPAPLNLQALLNR